MREIKFRAWNKYKNEMNRRVAVSGKNVIAIWADDYGQICSRFIDDQNDARYDYIAMQYTGLKDKNGVEAYHKDIGIDKFNKKVIIEWNENHLCYGLLTIDDIVKDEWNFCLKDLVEIIGNIYENKELLN